MAVTLPYTEIGEALRGVEIQRLSDGVTPLEAIVLVKAVDGEGLPTWALRYSPGLSKVEAIGALRVTLNHEECVFEAGWNPEEEDD